MSATLKGRAVKWSIGGITFTAGIVSATNPAFPQSARFNRGSKMTEVVDDDGVLRTQIFHGFKKTLSMTVIPAAPTNSASAANSSADAYMPAPGTTITAVDASGTVIDASYNLISASQSRSVEGVVSIDLELEQGDEGNDLTTAAAA